MSVYLNFIDADSALLDEDEPARTPYLGEGWSGPIPRVGEYVYGHQREDGWYEVLTVSYSSLSRGYEVSGSTCWVDMVVRHVEFDPREPA